MSIEANEALYLRYLDALTAPDGDALRALLAPDFVAHDLPPGLRDAGPEGLIRFRAMANAAVPDQKVEPLHMISTGDLVAAHMRVTGTHQGAFRGIAPTGRAITWEVFEFARIDGSKIAERWALVEWVKIYQQMGVTEIPQG